MAEVIYLDGVAAAVTDLGKFDANGNWVPIDPSGLTFGTNGFHLDFANSAALGTDASGNGNNFTVNSMSSANATNDNPADDAANGYGNYATINALYPDTGSTTFSEGNTKAVNTSATTGTFGLSIALPTSDTQIYYAEFILGNNGNDTNYLGAADAGASVWGTSTQLGTASGHVGLRTTGGAMRIHYDGSNNAATTTPDAANDRFVVAVKGTKVWLGLYDNSAGNTKWVDQSGTERTTDEPALGTNATYDFSGSSQVLVGISIRNNTSNGDMQLQADSGDWVGTPPSGAVSINTASLPAPTVTDPSAYFSTVLYTGDGNDDRDIGGLNFQPDLVWIKDRDNAKSHQINDAVRGTGKNLSSDSSGEEVSDADRLQAFNSDGFQVGTHTNVNANTADYVAWCLKANGAGSSNTDGSVTSTASVADHNGFAIIKHTNTSGDYTVGHGMGQAPDMLIQKGLGSQGWLVWTAALGVDGYLALHSTDPVANPAGDPWSDTSPTSSVFTIAGTTWYGGSSFNIVTYAFARTPGLIGIGSFEGNASADGSYVVVDDGGSGFAPAFVMIKNIDGGSWCIFDNARPGYNASTKGLLFPNATSVENNTNNVDFIANGFKCRGTSAAYNQDTLIYLAFAEFPFGGSGVAQARAR